MKLWKKILAFILVIFAIIIITFYVVISIITSIYSPDVTIKEISSSTNQKLYLKKKVWGITWDYQVIVLSDSDEKDFVPDSTKEYVYKGSSEFFYKFKNDTLNLYVNMDKRIPEKFFSPIKVNQIVMGSLHLSELNSTYKSKGLEKIEE